MIQPNRGGKFYLLFSDLNSKHPKQCQQRRPVQINKGAKNILSQNFLLVLQKYNINPLQKTLAERLCEPDRFKDFSLHAGDLLLDFSRTGMEAMLDCIRSKR